MTRATRRRVLLPAMLALLLPMLAIGQEDDSEVSVNVAPPDLPAYDQPPIPGDGYQWAPGYWAWSDDDQDYYWVPGTWVMAPEPDVLWTPGYWGVAGDVFLWHPGYWGANVGYYGGVDYGFGYFGHGFDGGYWRTGHFFYNRAVANVGNGNLPFSYNRAVFDDAGARRVSYNGGGGNHSAPNAAELAAAHEPRLPPASAQFAHERAARADPSLHLIDNAGVPPVAATAHPGAFSGPGVIAARHGSRPGPSTFSVVSVGGAENAAAPAVAGEPRTAGESRTLAPGRARPAPVNRPNRSSGNARTTAQGSPVYGQPEYNRPQRPSRPPAAGEPRRPPSAPPQGESRPAHERAPERAPARMPEHP